MFNTMKKKLLSVGAVVTVAASQAQAALVAPTLDTVDAVTVAGAVLAGLAVIWGVKKAIALVR